MRRPLVHALFAALSVLAALPLLRAEHPPLQDLPQHLAAISVLLHYPDQGLGQLFEIDLFRTQYLSYYGLAWLLAHVMSVAAANKLLLVASVVALPWSLAALLEALGGDRRAALFAFPLLYNAHLILGFFNFIAALPCLFWGLALAVRERGAPDRRRRIALAALLLFTFYTHVVPFALLALGVAAIFLGRGAWRRWPVFVPALVALGYWLASAPAGRATVAASGLDASAHKAPVFTAAGQALRELPGWLTDVFVADLDDQLLAAWGVLFLAALALRREVPPTDALGGVRARLALFAPLCLGLYFVTPSSYDWIWPISARFPLLALLFSLLLLPTLRGFAGLALSALISVHAAASFHMVDRAFARFAHEEVGDIDGALAAIPEGQHVMGLIFDRGSHVVKFSPFLHYVALYQAQKGGAVMFSFADFPQSPFRFREQGRPPRVPPRWEWTPERVRPENETFYSYFLVRGGSRNVSLNTALFDSVFRGTRWQVYRRRNHM